MCTGGVYLVGGLTLAVLDKLKEMDIVEKYCKRHPEIEKIIKKTPVIVCLEVDLGLKGAYVYARRIISDEQHD
jgi:glucokinase